MPYRAETTAEDGTNAITISNHVKLDEATARPLASSKSAHSIKIKLHDKLAALADVGKHLGMFTQSVEHTGKDGDG
jgi:phage terminase small subunit